MHKYLSLFFVLVLPLCLIGQQKPDYVKKTYVSPEGKLYIQKQLGIYLWLSTSPEESSKKHKLISETTAKYSNPMYFDTDGWNTVRSPSAVDPETKKPVYPLQDIIFEVYADDNPPKTSIDYGESKPYKLEGKTYVMAGTKVNLNANDGLSGVEGIYFSVDGQAFVKYSQPITFTEEREYSVKFYAVDNVGNDEEIQHFNYIYDNTSPVTTRKINKDEYQKIISARSRIELSAEDKGIGVKKIVYKINDGKEYTYTIPLRAANLPQGEHTITYYSVDKVWNKEAVQTYSFYIDKTAPTIIEEVIGKSFFANGKEFSSGKAQLKLIAFDNKAGVKEIRYSINNGEYKVYNKPVFLTQTSGNFIIKTYAIDNVNNKSTSQTANQKTSIPYIDLSGPTLRYTLSGPEFKTRDTTFVNSKTKVALWASELESGVNRIEYSINGDSVKVYNEPFSLSEEGVYTISYTGYDNVENTSSASLTVKVDNTGPTINHQFSTEPVNKTGDQNIYPKYVILFMAGTDNVVGLENIKYGFNNSAYKIFTVPVTGLSAGPKTMHIIGTDKLGNTTEQEIKFQIKE